MLGISAGNVLEHEGEAEPALLRAEGAVTLVHNDTDPTRISDGIDVVTVQPASEDTYRIDYAGFHRGWLVVTRTGVEELGASLLAGREGVPSWLVEDAPNPTPDWFPDGYEPASPVVCQHCGEETPPGEIRAPEPTSESSVRYCATCWEEVRSLGAGQWDQPTPREHASALSERAQDDPAAVDIEAVVALVDGADDPEVRAEALRALLNALEDRPEAGLDHVPLLASCLDSGNVSVRALALYCLADLAEAYPSQLAPVADDVVQFVGPDIDPGLLEGSLPYVAAIADDDPGVVLDAVPRLEALVQEGPPRQATLLAITRIAKAYPESVLPVVPDLVAHVEDDDRSNRVGAMAALGYVSKEYPDETASLLPTLVELLDADADRLRANAAGLLADLADDHRAELRSAVPRVIELLADGDRNARYNATSILSRIAKEYPEDVEPAVDGLRDALDDEFAYSRSNACWALGRLRAAEARADLERLAAADPEEEVRTAAGWALDQLDRDG